MHPAALLALLTAVHAEPIALKAATFAAEGTPVARLLARLGGEVVDLSGGGVRLDVVLGQPDEAELVRQCREGTLALVAVRARALAALGVPEFAALELPFVFEQTDDDALNGALFEPAAKLLAARGLTPWLWAEDGWAVLASRFGPVRHAAELRGRKVAVLGNAAVQGRTFAALGAEALVLRPEEVEPALAEARVDAVVTTPAELFEHGWQHLVGDVNVWDQAPAPVAVVWSAARLGELAPELRRRLLDRRTEQARWVRTQSRALQAPTLGVLERMDPPVRVWRLTATERGALAAAVAPVYPWFHDTQPKNPLLDLLRPQSPGQASTTTPTKIR